MPFDFVVRGRTFPAARYRIGRLDRANPDMLVLKSSTDKMLLIFQTQRLSPAAKTESSRLTFRRPGETNFLESIAASGQSYDSRLPSVKWGRLEPLGEPDQIRCAADPTSAIEIQMPESEDEIQSFDRRRQSADARAD